MDTEALVVDAFAQLGIDTRVLAEGSSPGAEMVLDPNGVGCSIQVMRRSLVTEDVAQRLLADVTSSADPLLIVADRVTDAARTVLTSHRGGYLDLRGRLVLRTDRMVIDAKVEPVTVRAERSSALSGTVGLEVATALLMRPGHAAAVRELARELRRSPSTVSEILAVLRRDGLIDARNDVTDARLFWQVANRWPTERTRLARPPTPGEVSLAKPLQFGADDIEHAGWALTDSAAAVAYGAPVAVRTDQALDFFVPNQAIVRRAITLLGVASDTSPARATLRVAPVAAVVQTRIDLKAKAVQWPIAHPLFVALDLAQDVGRGREILDAWTPDDRWARVW
jgi:DNA-binding transcriptional ArsR family regulator